MKNLLALSLVVAVVLSLTEARSKRSVGSLTLRAFPRIVVLGVHTELRLECRHVPGAKHDLTAVLIHLERIDGNGTASLVAFQKINALLQTADNNRTSADGHLQGDKDNKESFLSATIETPTLEDDGIYQCRYAFIDENTNVHTLGSKVNVTVSELPVPDYTPYSECDCDNIWTEINKLKAALAMRNDNPGQPAQPFDDKCRTSFSARFATRFGYAIVSDATASFDDIISQKGNSYDPNTGIFTAPCAGQYFFTATLRSRQNPDSGYVEGVIAVDGEPRARTSVFLDSALENYQSATNGVILSLKEGQQVKVIIKTTSSGEFIGEDFSVFSGFFLFP